MQVFSPRAALACYLMLLVAYLAGAVMSPLEGGAAGYANIALAIHEEGKWTQLMLQGQDYQGGPPLLFWLVAVSYELFGVNAVAYKLPSLLFSVLAVYSTVRLGTLLYNNETVARLAGVILASAFALLLANSDADMDVLLIGSVVFATCQLFIFVTDEHKLSARAHLVVAGAGLALGMAAKGLVGVVLPLLAVFLYLIYRLEWRRIFDPFWLLLPPVVLLFASPVLYAYHAQFGMDGVMKFVLWLQSAENSASLGLPEGEGRDLFFYYYSYLWAFLPWSAIALWALVSGARRLMNDRYWPRAQGEAVTLGVIVTVFIFLVLARFNLLHYVSVLLPFFALMLANWLPALLRHPGSHHWLWRVQYVVLALVLNAALVFNGWMFPLQDWALAVLALALLALGIWGIPRWSGGSRLIIVSVSVSAVFWMLVNLNIYSGLLENQAGTGLGKVLMNRHAGTENVYYLEGDAWAASFDIAIRRRAKPITLDALASRDRPTVLFVTAEGRERIEEEKKELLFDVLGQNSNHDFSRIGWAFLNPNTRKDELRAAYLLQVRPR
ncbi:MAG: glycosyltransferase family 39 protein [Azoarcus sp.]|nr:glycosyltransferase family 39 protein [Azoarcus sp.]